MTGPNITESEVLRAYLDCRRRKRTGVPAVAFDLDLVRNVCQLTRDLRNRTWRPGTSMCFAVTIPKPREVWAAQFRDRVVHHVIYNRLRPRLEPRFLPTSFACIPGRGTGRAIEWAGRALRRATAGWTREAWVLQLDVANFFTTIDRHILMRMLEPHMPEPWLATATRRVFMHDITRGAHLPGNWQALQRVPPHKSLWQAPPGKGLPIGNLTSQFAANVYLNGLDQHISHVIRPRFYGRYVDDLMLIDPDRARLRDARDAVADYATRNLALTLHHGKTHLQRARHGVDFVGVRLMPHRTYLRATTVGRAMVALKTAPLDELLATANSYLGVASRADTYRLRQRWCRIAQHRGLIPAPDFTKMLRPPALEATP